MALRNIIHYIQLMLDVSIVAWSIKISMKVQKKNTASILLSMGLRNMHRQRLIF